jgi:hypothetical protein
MKLTGTLLGLAAVSVAVAEDFNPNHAVNMVVTMKAKPGKMKQVRRLHRSSRKTMP